MAQKVEFVGTVQFWPNGARGNPVALYMEKLENGEYRISARLPQWRHLVGVGATVNKAAGNYELTLKTAMPADGAYEGPYWNSGIKAEKPAPPKPVAAAPPAGGGPADAPPAPTGTPSVPPQGGAPASS
ncbi:MAG: hypothetical protein E6K68_03985 [Nitrospirae bacterium]|nr:MAG: hypothetical protein E6K68_03985 [Nitrospirota bacterium]